MYEESIWGIFNKICIEYNIRKNPFIMLTVLISEWFLLKSSTVYTFLLSENFILEIYRTNYFSESFNQNITPVNEEVKRNSREHFLLLLFRIRGR